MNLANHCSQCGPGRPHQALSSRLQPLYPQLLLLCRHLPHIPEAAQQSGKQAHVRAGTGQLQAAQQTVGQFLHSPFLGAKISYHFHNANECSRSVHNGTSVWSSRGLQGAAAILQGPSPPVPGSSPALSSEELKDLP